MGHCDGTLVIHADGTAAACSEELAGRCCAGEEAVHLGGNARCEVVLGPGGCEWCDVDPWNDHQWRHVVHVGGGVRAQRRCRVPVAGAGRPDASRPLPTGVMELAARR